jgi:arylsulfate sulfotransferase
MSPKQNWGKSGRKGKGYETNPYLLTALNNEGIPYSKDIQTGHKSADDFDFPRGPHAPSLLPNGNIIVFDNRPFRNYNNENNYSRALEYEVNEADKTFRKIWQYGKNRGLELFSTIVSDVDYLPKTKNILMTSGFVSPKDNHRAKVVEVSTKDNTEVFEATIFFKSTNKGSKPGWGQTDILYRSERMELKN